MLAMMPSIVQTTVTVNGGIDANIHGRWSRARKYASTRNSDNASTTVATRKWTVQIVFTNGESGFMRACLRKGVLKVWGYAKCRIILLLWSDASSDARYLCLAKHR